MIPWVKNRALELFDDLVVFDNISQTPENERCIVCGTLCKKMSKKPNLLKEYITERSIVAVSFDTVDSFCSNDDTLILEDVTSTRTNLDVDPETVQRYPTGLIVAVAGKRNNDGNFVVENIILPGLPVQTKYQLSFGVPKFVIFISGINAKKV